jgi:hypothetical protein
VTRTSKTHTAQKHSGRIGTMAVMLAMAAATGLAGAAPAAALSVSRAELVSGTGTVRAGEPFWLAVHIQLDDGWHTYWRNRGDSGASPLINWQLPPRDRAGAGRLALSARVADRPCACRAPHQDTHQNRIHGGLGHQEGVQ